MSSPIYLFYVDMFLFSSGIIILRLMGKSPGCLQIFQNLSVADTLASLALQHQTTRPNQIYHLLHDKNPYSIPIPCTANNISNWKESLLYDELTASINAVKQLNSCSGEK